MIIIAFDDTRKSVKGTTETEVKYFRFSISNTWAKWKQLIVVVSIWVDGGTGTVKIYIDDETSPRLSFSSASTTEEIKKGTINVGDLAEGIHTLRVKLVNSGDYTTYTELLEVYAR